MIEQHEQWLSKAADDLRFAEVGLENKFNSQVCFLSQQVIEKSLKAFMIFRGRLYPKTHKLTELWRLCTEIESELSPLNEELKVVDEYYIPARYPDALPGSLSGGEPTKENAAEALETAQKVYEIVREHIK